jgi:3-hydroxybutyryl-CoA dehydrogenase
MMRIDNIQNICAVGTGVMGARTALCFAMHPDFNVTMWGRTDESLEKGMNSINSALSVLLEHNVISQVQRSEIIGRIAISTDLSIASRSADFVIESIAEDMEIKHRILKHLSALCPPTAFFGTNTSSLSPTKLATVLSERHKPAFIATHFFSPPHLMPVVEIIPGRHTAPETFELAMGLMIKIGKQPIPLEKELPGFVVNRIQIAILLAAAEIVQRGHASADLVDITIERTLALRLKSQGTLNETRHKPLSPEQNLSTYIESHVQNAMLDAVDEIVRRGVATPEVISQAVQCSLGLRLPVTGPLRSADMGGLDIFAAIQQNVHGKNGSSKRDAQQSLVQSLAIAGHHGVKTGQGFYEWTPELVKTFAANRQAALIEHLRQ